MHPLFFETASQASFLKTPYVTIAVLLKTPVFQNILNPFRPLTSNESKKYFEKKNHAQPPARH